MKKIFEVKIEETLCRVVSVEAETEEAARAAVKTRYYDEEIVLDEGDLIGTTIEIEEAL